MYSLVCLLGILTLFRWYHFPRRLVLLGQCAIHLLLVVATLFTCSRCTAISVEQKHLSWSIAKHPLSNEKSSKLLNDHVSYRDATWLLACNTRVFNYTVLVIHCFGIMPGLPTMLWSRTLILYRSCSMTISAIRHCCHNYCLSLSLSVCAHPLLNLLPISSSQCVHTLKSTKD